VEDLAQIWRREIKREDIGRLVNPHIAIHLDRLNAGDETTRISPRLIGAMTPWPGLVDAPHRIGPIGIINAGDSQQAAWDAQEVCLLLQPPTGGGVESSKVVAAATAEAFSPNATVDSVIDASIRHLTSHGREIIEETLEIARKYPDLKAIREPIRQHFMPTYPYADGMETAAEVMALFYITKGDVRDGLIGSTNLGRDTDCIAGMLGSICGAFKGIDEVPAQWVETCQKAINANKYTRQKMSMKETAKGLTKALAVNAEKMRDRVAMLAAMGLEL
jgi:ADP-ribosylglycohydrolase